MKKYKKELNLSVSFNPRIYMIINRTHKNEFQLQQLSSYLIDILNFISHWEWEESPAQLHSFLGGILSLFFRLPGFISGA